jgi:hypothetical protein
MKKKLMFKYLDAMYPELYILELDFLGDIVQTFDEERQADWLDNRQVGRGKGSWYDQRKEIIEGLMLMFCVTQVAAEIILDEWVWSRPKYKYVRESTDEQVLVPVSQ